MSTPPPGWYDDPAASGRVRYWNGVGWTDHVADRDQVVAGQAASSAPPQPAPPAVVQAPEQLRPGDPGASPPTAADASLSTAPDASGPTAPDASGPTEPDASGPTAPDADPGAGVFGRPGPTRTAAPAASRSRRPRTSDGTPLAPWWRRLVARILDEFVCGILGLPLILPVVFARGDGLSRYLDAVREASLGGRSVPVATDDVVATVEVLGLLGVLVYFTYETVGLVRYGTTLGRKAMRIRVRRCDRGPLNLEAVSRRSAVKVAGPVVSGAPGIGDAGLFIVLIDIGRGLLDRGRRTVHDLAGGTEVVLEERPARDAGSRH